MHKDLFSVDDGIVYHQPLDNRPEWVTAKDSGRLIAAMCADYANEEWWNEVCNIGGGGPNRLTAYEFLTKFYVALGLDFTRLEKPEWYATRNFHGLWYLDSSIMATTNPAPTLP